MSTRWYIVGCGYVGTRLARKLVEQGSSVSATRRSATACNLVRLAVPGAQLRSFELGQEDLDVEEGAVLVLCAPPGNESPAAEQILAEALPASVRLIYLSTTGVYGEGRGAEVNDDYALAPNSARGRARLDVEAAIRSVHQNTVCLRIPGIYGPHRGVHERMLRGEYRLIGAAETLVARIHVDDLVEAVVLLGDTQDLPRHEFIIGDDTPTSSREHALGIATALKLPEPPMVDPNTVSAAVRAMLGADRRVVPRGLRALGWRCRYPSWREGLAQALAEEALQP